MAGILIGSTLGIGQYPNMYANATDSFDSSNPHSAVTRIIEAISDSHTDALVRLTDSKRAHQLTGRSSPRPEELRKVLHNSLIDVLSLATWSLATAPRLPAPDTEIVKWVRTGPTVEVVREPHLVTANTFPVRTFQFRYAQQGWVPVKLDDSDPATTGG